MQEVGGDREVIYSIVPLSSWGHEHGTRPERGQQAVEKQLEVLASSRELVELSRKGLRFGGDGANGALPWAPAGQGRGACASVTSPGPWFFSPQGFHQRTCQHMDTNKRVGNGRLGLFLLWKERQTREGVAAQDTESGIRGGRGHGRNTHGSWEPSWLSAVSWPGLSSGAESFPDEAAERPALTRGG